MRDWLVSLVTRKPGRVVDVTLVLDDIVEQDVDVVVNAADESLLGGTGVDGAIQAAAGPAMGKACLALGGCRTGRAKMTPGFGLKARWVLHAVAPIWMGGDPRIVKADRDCMEALFLGCLLRADAAGLKSIAFPTLGAGGFGWSPADVARCGAAAVRKTRRKLRSLGEIRFVAFGPRAMAAWERELQVKGTVRLQPGQAVYHEGVSVTG